MPSLLHTDAYKFSMAEAGWPLRRETFTWSFRMGGPHLLPFDIEAVVRSLLPDPKAASWAAELQYLESVNHPLGGAVRAAFRRPIRVDAIPRGTWFFDREPAFSITGPSALVSWLEPLLIQLHYRVQLATLARLEPAALPDAVARVSCERQREIVHETLDAIGVKAPPVAIDSEGYVAHVRSRVAALVRILEDPGRLFEVGLRSTTCPEQHLLALEACKAEGITDTSDVAGARALGLRPVGTMGHEHVQRYGDDDAAFRAMRERRPGPCSFLLDTYSTLESGIPAAFALIAEEPDRNDAIRYDSGDKEAQYLYACARARGLGVSPRHVLEDAFDAELTARFEALRSFTGVAATDQLYGIGGHIVASPFDPLPRDRVAAVYKLSQSGVEPTMKFADDSNAGKASLPGRPVLYRTYTREDGSWSGLVAQEGEAVDPDAVRLTGASELPHRVRFTSQEVRGFARPEPELSPATRQLIARLEKRRERRRR